MHSLPFSDIRGIIKYLPGSIRRLFKAVPSLSYNRLFMHEDSGCWGGTGGTQSTNLGSRAEPRSPQHITATWDPHRNHGLFMRGTALLQDWGERRESLLSLKCLFHLNSSLPSCPESCCDLKSAFEKFSNGSTKATCCV